MYPIIAKIGSLEIYSHGLLIVIAVIVSAGFLYFMAKRFGLRTNNFIDNISTTLLVGIIGSRLTYGIVYHKELENFWQIFYIWRGGLVSWGGFITGGLTIIYLLYRQKEPIAKWLDLISLSTLLGLAIGRIGCYLTGDIPGKISNRLVNNLQITLAESILCFIAFVLILWIYLAVKSLRPGMILIYTVFAYSLIRLSIDGYRDLSPVFIGLNIGQLFALLSAIVILVIMSVGVFSKRSKHE